MACSGCHKKGKYYFIIILCISVSHYPTVEGECQNPKCAGQTGLMQVERIKMSADFIDHTSILEGVSLFGRKIYRY